MTAAIAMVPEAWNPEHALVGTLLEAGPHAVSAAAEQVGPADFADERAGAIFEAILALDAGGKPVSLVTVAEVLKALGKLALAGGPAFLAALPEAHGLAPVTEYARLVREKGARRHLRRVCGEVADMTREEAVELSCLLDMAGQKFNQVLLQQQRASFKSMSALVEEALASLDGGISADLDGVQTGFPAVDKVLVGMQPGELIVLAARPGVGKTAFAMQVAEFQAHERNVPVAVFSLEMPARQLVLRLAAGLAQVPLERLRRGRMTTDQGEAVAEAMEVLHQAPIHIDDSADLTPMDIRAKARRLKQLQPDLGLVVVDYLQLMRLRHRAESRQVEVAEISRSLKLLAKELQLPVLALSQLSRRAEDRKGPPLLSDLRESGAIEQDADAVLFLHNAQARPAAIEVHVAKQRNGPLGDGTLTYKGDYAWFSR